ncbi:MAG: hypothetical protein ABI769_00345 [Pseudomonadota bacterium]
MTLVVFFLVFVFAIAGDDLRWRWLRSRMANPPPLARRLPAAHLYRLTVTHLIVAAVLLVTYGDDWSLAAITAHVFGDVFPFPYLRHNLCRARQAQSRKFQAAK